MYHYGCRDRGDDDELPLHGVEYYVEVLPKGRDWMRGMIVDGNRLYLRRAEPLAVDGLEAGCREPTYKQVYAGELE